MCTHPRLEKLVVDLEEPRQLHADLLHGDRDKAHVPVQTTHFLFQELDQELCKQPHDIELRICQTKERFLSPPLAGNMLNEFRAGVQIYSRPFKGPRRRPHRRDRPKQAGCN